MKYNTDPAVDCAWVEPSCEIDLQTGLAASGFILNPFRVLSGHLSLQNRRIN